MALQASDEAVCDGRLPHGPRPLTAYGSTLAEAQCALMCLGRCLLKIFPLGRGAWQCRSLSSLHGCRSGSLTVDLSTSTPESSSCRTSAAAGSESAAAGSWVLLVHMYDTYIKHAHTRRA